VSYQRALELQPLFVRGCVRIQDQQRIGISSGDGMAATALDCSISAQRKITRYL
jgi:hypothetical protein